MQPSTVAAPETTQPAERLERDGEVISHAMSVAHRPFQHRITAFRVCVPVAIGMRQIEQAVTNTFVGALL